MSSPRAHGQIRRGRPTLCAALAVVCAVAFACNRDPCAGLHPPTADAGAPRIVDVAIAGQDIINPWQFNLAVVFADDNGDMGQGLLDIYVGTSEPLTLPLAPYFATSSVAPNSHAGRLGIDLNLSSSAVQDDSLVRLGFQLRDELRHYSNCYSLELHFDVDKLGLWQRGPAKQVPCGSRLALGARP